MDYNEEFMTISKREMRWARKTLMLKANGTLGICETLRMIYDLIEDHPDPKIKELATRRLLDAIVMAKNMSNRLRYYKDKYGDTTGGGFHNLFKLHGCNKRSKLRLRRKI